MEITGDAPTEIDTYSELEGKEAADVKSKILAALADIKLDGSIGYGTLVAARRPGGPEAHASRRPSQRVLGGIANIAREYATKRYRSNLINWGMLPLLSDGLTLGNNKGSEGIALEVGDLVILPGVRRALAAARPSLTDLSAARTEARHPMCSASARSPTRREQ